MITRPCIFLLLSLAVFACGEESPAPEPTPPVNTATDQGGSGGQTSPPLGGGGAGGTPAEAGSGGTSGGSSDGGQPASDEVRGAVSLNILSPEGCSLDAQFLDFPEVPDGHPVTATEKSVAIENGGTTTSGQPVKLGCNWRAEIANITLNVGAAGKNRRIILDVPNQPGGTAANPMLLNAFDLPDQYGPPSDAPCDFSVIESDEASRSVWGQFSCSGFVALTGDEDICAVGPSFFFFENCTQ